MGTEITVAAIGILGTILGFLASYFVQAQQRKWSLDDQRREWRRKYWTELSDRYKRVTDMTSRIYLNKKFTVEDEAQLSSWTAETLASPPSYDPKLKEWHTGLIGKIMEMAEIVLETTSNGQILLTQEANDRLAIKAHEAHGFCFRILEFVDNKIDETYSLPPSPLQRFTNWVQSKRKRASQARP